MQKKNYLTIRGYVEAIGELQKIPRKGNTLYKRVLKIVTEDNQVLFPEVRNKKLKLVEQLEEGDFATVQFSFEGSEKNGKMYNNIFVYDIKTA